MRKLVSVLLCIVVLLLCSCNKNPSNEKVKKTNIVTNEEMRAVWINYYELSMKNVGGGNSEQFESKITKMFDKVNDYGLNTVIVHVRPFSDAFYKSNTFPYSKYLTGQEGKDPGYDPLKIMCKIAKSKNLKIHAWINPYRVIYDTNFDKVSDKNPAKIYKYDNIPDNDSWIVETESGIFYNPSVPEVQKLIIEGVREIVQNYDIDGIHIDDYFYPSTDSNIDKIQYDSYLKSGGKRSLDDWRRDNVNSFISGMYSTVKQIKPDVQVSISPSGDIQKNYNSNYADIKEWIKNPGYLDYIIPQLYYGFNNETKPFKSVANEWSNLLNGSDKKICYGLSLYKCGKEDEFAGKGKDEWLENKEIIKRQLEYCNSLSNYAGFVYYSYGYLNKLQK